MSRDVPDLLNQQPVQIPESLFDFSWGTLNYTIGDKHKSTTNSKGCIPRASWETPFSPNSVNNFWKKRIYATSESRDQRILKIFLSLLRISSHKEGSTVLGKKSPDTGCHKAGENPLSQKKLIHKYCTQMQESCGHQLKLWARGRAGDLSISSDCGGGKEEEELGSNERILSKGSFYGVPVRRRDEEKVLELWRKHAKTIALQNLPGRPCLRCVKEKRVLRA
jgi:hypothetical protein